MACQRQRQLQNRRLRPESALRWPSSRVSPALASGCTGCCGMQTPLPYWNEQSSLTIPLSATMRRSDIAPERVRCFALSTRRRHSSSLCISRMARFSILRGLTFRTLRRRVYLPPPSRKGGELGGEATAEFIDIPRNGKSIDELELQVVSRFSATLLDVAGSSLS